MTTPLLEVLRRARLRLTVPGQWTKGALARDASARIVPDRSPAATCWCAAGAVFTEASALLSDNEANALAVSAIAKLRAAVPGGPCLDLSAFNDAQETVVPVLDVFDAVIARLESAPAAP